MRFTCPQQSFLEALEIVSKVIDTNSTLPVLSNILVKAEGKRVFFSATNLDMVINHSIEAGIKNEGAVTVPARLLLSYISLLKDKDIEIKLDDGLSLSVISKSSKTKMKCIAAEDFPLVSQIEKEAVIALSSKDFVNAIQKTSFAAATNNTRPALAGIYLHASKKNLKFVATDSYRLSEQLLELDASLAGEVSVIIPVRAISEAARIVSKIGPKEVEISLGKSQVMFRIGETDFISRLIEGKFPNYEAIIPKESKTTIGVVNDDFALALKRVQLFAKENNNKIIIKTSKDGMEITTPATQIGEETCSVDAKVEGEDGLIALNSQYVLDVLATLQENIIVTLKDRVTPAVISDKEGKGFTHIIMPLKIQDI